MHPFIAALVAHAPVITDGAWGTQLQAAGLPPGACPDAWNLERPDAVRAVAAGYVAAGSQIILSNTFGANRLVLERHGLGDQVAAINRAGAQLSREAAGDRALVFASLGPCGRLLAAGEVEETVVAAAFAEQAAALKEGGAHAVVVETMADVAEARLAVAAVKAVGLPVVASFTFDSGKQGDRTMTGATPEKALQAMVEAGADVIGANCGKGMDGIIPIIKRLTGAGLPVWAKPNGGLPVLVDGKTVHSCDPAAFARGAAALRAAGATFIGACCGSSPVVIAALAQTFRR